MYYINIFFFYSIIGYLLETLGAFILNNGFESGILYGPITPIYGIGALVIMYLSEKVFKNLHLNKIVETIILFILVTIILTILEFLAGITIEKLFNIVFWDYSNHKYHLGKYISLTMSLIWGGISIIFTFIIKPLFDKFILKIPKYITIILSFLFIIDIIITIKSKL